MQVNVHSEMSRLYHHVTHFAEHFIPKAGDQIYGAGTDSKEVSFEKPEGRVSYPESYLIQEVARRASLVRHVQSRPYKDGYRISERGGGGGG